MKSIAIINGPNLNLLGIREPELYGKRGFLHFLEELQAEFGQVAIDYFQSNIEGELIDHLHRVGFTADAILFNAGGYTHTSVALRDAVSAISAPVLEVHLTQIYARETFRHRSFLSPVCVGSISGLGLEGYRLGLLYFVRQWETP
ncbi:MAG: type II 3-dehydroquinate dehydratase [Bernardetiaceae bacterium]